MVRRRTARGLKLGKGTVCVNVSGLLVENRSPAPDCLAHGRQCIQANTGRRTSRYNNLILVPEDVVFLSQQVKAFDDDAPAIVQIAPIFAGGLGWESLIGTVMKVVH